jgi:hypothetical protein
VVRNCSFLLAILCQFFKFVKKDFCKGCTYQNIAAICTNFRQLTNSMELSPSWDTANFAATKKFPNILQNLKVHYCVHNSPTWPFVEFHSKLIFLRWGVVTPWATLKIEIHSCWLSWLLIQCICSYASISGCSICNLRTHHAMATRDAFNMDHCWAPNFIVTHLWQTGLPHYNVPTFIN